MILDVKKKRRLFILFSVLIVFILGFILVDNSLYKPTKLNSFIASKVYKTPANKAFTDDNFYKCVVDAYNETNNTTVAYTENLTDEQLETIKVLSCNGKDKNGDEKIYNTSGLEKLINLNRLSLNSNSISSIDISKNTNLKNLNLSDNKLSSLNLLSNTNLESILISQNSLSILRTTGLSKLVHLSANLNNLVIVDVSTSTNLEELQLYNNKINNIDLSKNVNLRQLVMPQNQLNSIDLSNNTEIQILELGGSCSYYKSNASVFAMNCGGNSISEIDLSNNKKLFNLSISFNKLIGLDLTSNNLKKIEADVNGLNQIIFGDISKLENVSLIGNNLTEIDLTGATNLERLDLSDNALTELNLDNDSKLEFVKATNNDLSNINISNSVLLKELSLSGNNLRNIDVSKNTNLEKLLLGAECTRVENNAIVSGSCDLGNSISDIDLSNNTKLTKLYFRYNNLETIDLSNNLLLEELDVRDNLLKAIDLSKNEKLTRVQLNDNPYIKNVTIYKGDKYLLESPILLAQILLKSQYSGYSWDWTITKGESKVLLDSSKIVADESGQVVLEGDFKKSPYLAFESKIIINIVEATSDKYEINAEAGYIYTKTDTDVNTILSNISLNYGEGKIEDNKYNIYYEDELIKSFDIVNVSSEIYKITDDYIYYENGDMLMSNIKVTNATVITLDNSSHNYKMRIKYNDIVVDELDYVTYYSREYDLTKDYIFGDVNLDLIDTTNLIKEVTNNKLVIRYNDEIFKSIDIVKIESDYYLTDNYIYIGSDTFDINKVDVINGNEELKDNKLIIKYNNEILKNYLIKSINFGTLKNANKNIIITEDMSYEEFTSNITLSEGLDYKIFNGESEITSGNISKGMTLKVYDGEEVIDEYEITDEYLEFDSLLKVDDSKNFISNISLESSVDSLLSKINTSGKVTIKDNKGNVIAGNSLVGTGYKIVVELTNKTYEYTVIVKGDVTGTGTSSISDVAKLYQYLKNKIDMDECYKEAGNVVSIDNEIKINDVAKLYQFIKKKINGLE